VGTWGQSQSACGAPAAAALVWPRCVRGSGSQSHSCPAAWKGSVSWLSSFPPRRAPSARTRSSQPCRSWGSFCLRRWCRNPAQPPALCHGAVRAQLVPRGHPDERRGRQKCPRPCPGPACLWVGVGAKPWAWRGAPAPCCARWLGDAPWWCGSGEASLVSKHMLGAARDGWRAALSQLVLWSPLQCL